jgi:di/tricarboxylate transporter
MKPKEGYAAVDWGLLILIYGMLVLGKALEESGATDLVANSLSGLAGILHFQDDHLSAMLMLAVCYLATAILTELLSNNATVVVMTPIAIGLATSLGVDPRPFIIATCVAASASFSTPIGYQTNTYVYSVGGYRFGDFMKVGLPLALLYFVGSLYIIPRVWSF